MTYAEAVAFLDGLANFERMTDYRYDSKNFGPGRTRRLLDEVGSPERRAPNVIVAGTKGKGSTAAMLSSILGACGRRVGLYTSPHLVEYTERIRIGGKPVGRDEFADLAGLVAGPVERLAAEGDESRPTTFEALTVMALLGFVRRGVDIAILEVGMGGRLDAVNAVDAAAVGITAISLDHTNQLGGTIPEIAREKAGVIRAPVPVVSSPQRDEALKVISDACRASGAVLEVAGRDISAEDVVCDAAGSNFTAVTPRGRMSKLRVALAGRHQVDNALVALGLAMSVDRSLTEDSARRGLAEVEWPGRLQVLSLSPRIVVDGAHNGESAELLMRALGEIFSPGRIALIVSVLRGHDAAAVLGALCPNVTEIMVPGVAHPRAIPAEELATLARRWNGAVATVPDVGTALADACRRYAGERDLILVTGSLSLVGAAMAQRALNGRRFL